MPRLSSSSNNIFLINYTEYINNIEKYNYFIMKKINEYNEDINIEKLDHNKYIKLCKKYVYQDYKKNNKNIIIPKDLLKIKEKYNNIIKKLMLKI